jgi:hypothetical protein
MSQVTFEKSNSDTIQGPETTFQLDAHVDITTVDSNTYRWVRTKKMLPTNLTSAICDNNLCYGPDDDSADFFMAAGSHFGFTCYFYPNNKGCGDASVELKVYDPNDATMPPIFTSFHGKIWCTATGISTITERELSVHPSPAKDFILVNYGSQNQKEIRVIDILGNVIIEMKSNSISTEIDVSHLKKGIYFVSVKEGSFISNKSFVKQ